MRLVVDANVAMKWFVREDLHEEARRLLTQGDLLFAPDFLVIELANVAWKKVRRNEIDKTQALEIAASHQGGVPALLPSTTLIEHAARLALALNHPVYDCLYLACAEVVDGVLVTADSRLRGAVKGSSYEVRVRPLDQMATALPPLGISRRKIATLLILTKAILATQGHGHDALTKDEHGFINLRDMELFFSSPSVRSSDKFLGRLTRDERADLLALMWLGQGYSGSNWRIIRARAERSIDGYSDNRYLIGLTVYLEKGIALFSDLETLER